MSTTDRPTTLPDDDLIGLLVQWSRTEGLIPAPLDPAVIAPTLALSNAVAAVSR